MALIKCGECGKEVSDKANECPHCGNPMTHVNVAPATPIGSGAQVVKRTEIVGTSKKWKKTWLLGLVLFIVGFFTLPNSIPGGFALLFFGFVIMWMAKIGAWWTNG